MAHRPRDISDAELEVLKVLWEHEPCTVRDLLGRLHERQWAYTTVQTLLQRLETKGYVKADRTALAHVFRTSVSRDGMVRNRLADLRDRICGGTTAPLILNLVRGQRFTAQELATFRELLDEAERGMRSRGRKRRK